jgi:hypothetical protein
MLRRLVVLHLLAALTRVGRAVVPAQPGGHARVSAGGLRTHGANAAWVDDVGLAGTCVSWL